MVPLRIVVLLGTLLCGVPVSAQGLRHVQEFRDTRFDWKMSWLNANRYLRVGRGRGDVKEVAGKRVLVSRGVLIYDLQKKELLEVRIPMEPFREKFKPRPLVPEPVFFDGRHLTFWVRVREKGVQDDIYFGSVDTRHQRVKAFKKVASLGKDQYFKPIAFDSRGEHFYYGILHFEGEGPARVTSAVDLARFDLRKRQVDWRFALRQPKRRRLLGLDRFLLDHRGKQLAVLEYNDSAHNKHMAIKRSQQVYVIDIDAGTMKTYPIPRTPYGYTFGRDDQTLFVGSYEEKKIIRINLRSGKVDRSVRTERIDGLDTTPDGSGLLVFYSINQAQQELLEVRQTSDLKKTYSTPLRFFYPDNTYASDGRRSHDGRLWLTLPHEKNGKSNVIDVYAVPDTIGEGGVSEDSWELQVARGVVTAKRFMNARGIVLSRREETKQDPKETFSCFIVRPDGDIFLTGTKSKPSRPLVARITADGKQKWIRDLAIPGYEEFVGAKLAVSEDARTVAHVMMYRHGGAKVESRLVMLSPTGKPLWQHHFRKKDTLGPPFVERVEFPANGTVVATGQVILRREPRIVRGRRDIQDVKAPWKAVFSKDGKLLSYTRDGAKVNP